MRLIGLTADQMEEELVRTDPEARKALDWMIERLVAYRRAVYPYQGMALYILAKQYDNSRANILEIGTAYGHSCFMIGAGAPQAHIVTLNPKEWEADTARKHLSVHHNVRVKETLSWEYLERSAGPKLDMILSMATIRILGMTCPGGTGSRWAGYLSTTITAPPEAFVNVRPFLRR